MTMNVMSHEELHPAETTGRARAWLRFLRERFALGALLVLGAVQAASAQYVVASELDWTGLVVAASAVAGLLGLLRLMDEIKDLDKDLIAHPDRPLPRGLVSEREARLGVRWGVAALLVFTAAVAVTRGLQAGALLALCVGFAVLMYREFFVPRFLEARPFLYAATHQVIILPLYAFATAVAVPVANVVEPVLWFGINGLGASFAVEICRKLDPDAHPVLRTYRSVYGPGATVAAVVVAALLTAFAAFRIGVHPFVWPAVAALLATLTFVLARPSSFKWAQGAAVFLLLAQVLAPTLARLTGVVG